MVYRRCPQCGASGDDRYGFCISCGWEFPKLDSSIRICPLCGYENPEEADFCVKCGTPIMFVNSPQNNTIGPIIIKKQESNPENSTAGRSRFMTILIVFGYVFSILGGLVGLIIALYLVTRKDANIRKHGLIQLAIFAFYIIVIAVLFATGNIPADAFTNYQQFILGNATFP